MVLLLWHVWTIFLKALCVGICMSFVNFDYVGNVIQDFIVCLVDEYNLSNVDNKGPLPNDYRLSTDRVSPTKPGKHGKDWESSRTGMLPGKWGRRHYPVNDYLIKEAYQQSILITDNVIW